MSPPDPTPRRHALEHALAALTYFALSAFYLRPILRVFGTHIAPDPGDPVFNLVVLKWGMHQIRLGLPDFWDLPFFFPARGATTYSDHLIGPAAFGTLLTSLQPNPLVVYNTLLLASFALSGWTTWYVLRRRGLGMTAAFLGGCMFAFCPIRWDQLSHLQILLMQWIPLTLWSWDRLLERPAWRRAALFFAVYALHMTGGSYLAYMIHVPMLILLLYRAPALWQDRRAAAKVLLPTGVLAVAVLAAVFLPYVRASRFQARSAAEIREYGASLASYGTFSLHNLYGSWSDAWRRPENSLFPGLTVTVLALVAAARALPRRRTPPRRPLAKWQKVVLRLLLTAALAGLVRGEIQTWELAGRFDWGLSVTPEALRTTSQLLALGLVALVLRRLWGGNWPLTLQGLDPFERGLLASAAVCFLLTFNAVYVPLSRQIPGLSGMRVPARFGVFVTFTLVVFAAREARPAAATGRSAAQGPGIDAARRAPARRADAKAAPMDPDPPRGRFPPGAPLAGPAGRCQGRAHAPFWRRPGRALEHVPRNALLAAHGQRLQRLSPPQLHGLPCELLLARAPGPRARPPAPLGGDPYRPPARGTGAGVAAADPRAVATPAGRRAGLRRRRVPGVPDPAGAAPHPRPLSHRPPFPRERGERRATIPPVLSFCFFSPLSRGKGGRWERGVGGVRGLQHGLAALGYFAISALYLRPVLRVLGTHIAPDPGDPLFILVVLKWGMHAIRNGLAGFWDAPFFFPARGVTAYSDHLLGPAAFGALLTASTPGALLVYNVLFFGSFVLCGWGTWYVLRRAGTGATAAFLGGCIYAFSSFRWDQLSHITILLMQWIPLTLWTWDRLLERPNRRRAAIFILFYALHVTGGSYLGYMIHIPLLILLLHRAPGLWRQGSLRTALRVLVPTGAACAALLLAVYLPYVRSAHRQERSAVEIRHYGASLASYFTPSEKNLYGGPGTESWWRRPENSLFAGFLPTALILLAAWEGRRRLTPLLRPLPARKRAALIALASLAVAGYLLAEYKTWHVSGRTALPPLPELVGYKVAAALLVLGLVALVLRRVWGGNWPLRLADLDLWEKGLLTSGVVCFLLSHPVVYLALREVVPGLSGMRVPARFYAFVSFPLAWFAARELDRLLRCAASPAWRRLGAAFAAVVLLVELAPKPLNWEPLPQERDFAPGYHWLAKQKDVRAVLELPIGNDSTEISYMYFATRHWKPLVNGYSGFFPTHYRELRGSCCWPLPTPRQLAQLRDWGVTHVLVHPEALEDKKWAYRALAAWESQPGISLEYDDGRDRVYRIGPGS